MENFLFDRISGSFSLIVFFKMESVDYKELLFKLVKNASPDDTKVGQSPLWTSFSGQKIIVGNDFIEKFSNQRIREKWREK